MGIEKKWFIGNAHGQLYSTDALLAFVVFAFALMMISVLTNQLQNQFVQTTAQEYGRLSALRMGQSLLASPGDPVYWDTNSDRNGVFRVGLVASGDSISSEKWSAFQDWNATDYPSLKRALGIADKDFFLTLTNSDRVIVARAGISPSDSNNVAFVMLPALYAGQPVMMNVQVYSP